MSLWVPTFLPIRERRAETADVATFRLDPGDSPLTFAPGQFNMLTVFGVGEVAISISGDPAAPGELVHTIRGVGGVTRRLLALDAGEALGVRGPFGTAWPMREAEGCDVLLIAGGIGLAPLRPAIYQLLAQRERYNRVIVLYGARRPEELLYLDELRAWRGRFDTRVEVTVDASGPGWRGPVGVVTRLLHQVNFDADDAVVMTCGPEIMMLFAIRELRKMGVPSERIWLSMERNMQCAVGLCGHCQWGPHFVCRDGPVFRYDRVAPLFSVREV